MEIVIEIETANQIREALGPDSITYQTMTAAELADDFEEFQIGRILKNGHYDWLSAILAIERIHLETDEATSKTPAVIAAREEQLNQMRRRVYAVKLKGDNMKNTKKSATKKQPVTQSKATGGKKNVKTTKGEPATSKAKPRPEPVAVIAAPKVGDPGLATEADFTNPTHSRLTDYRYYALLDNKNRIVGRGFLARVDKDARRTWFALRNEEQTKLWETSKWAIREVSIERYQELTLEYLKSERWPEFKSTRAKAAA